MEPKVTDRVDAVSKAGASKLTREVNNERFKVVLSSLPGKVGMRRFIIL